MISSRHVLQNLHLQHARYVVTVDTLPGFSFLVCNVIELNTDKGPRCTSSKFLLAEGRFLKTHYANIFKYDLFFILVFDSRVFQIFSVLGICVP